MNSTEHIPQYASSAVARYTILTTICFMGTLTFLGNIGTIVAFWKVRGLREKPGDLFILSLSCVDVLMGLVHISSISAFGTGRWIWGKTGCQILAILANITVYGGLLSTLLICWDRYLLISMAYPKYVKLQSKRRVIKVIAAQWCYTIMTSFIEIMIWDTVKVSETLYKFDYSQECRSRPKHNFIFQTLEFSRNIFLPLIVIEVYCVAFVVRLRRRLRRTDINTSSSAQEQQPGGSATNRRNVVAISTNATVATTVAHTNETANVSENARNPGVKPQNRYVKAAKTLTALIIALNVCMQPFILYLLLVSFMCPSCNIGLIRDILSLIVIPMNSCINPILYATTMNKIKQFYLKMFRLSNRNG